MAKVADTVGLQLADFHSFLRILVSPCMDAGLGGSPALTTMVAEVSSLLVQLPNSFLQIQTRALIAKDYCYEQLYLGDWSTVDVRWRVLYRAFCHLLALCQLHSIHDSEQSNCSSSNGHTTSQMLGSSTESAQSAMPLASTRAQGAIIELLRAALKLCDHGMMMGASYPHLLQRTLQPNERNAARRMDLAALAADIQRQLHTALDSTAPTTPSTSLPHDTVVSLDDATFQATFQPGKRTRIPRIPPPDIVEFMARAATNQPFVIEGGLADWPALQRWPSLEYWNRMAGDRTVPVELGGDYRRQDWTQTMMPLRTFIATYMQAAAEPRAKRAKRCSTVQHDVSRSTTADNADTADSPADMGDDTRIGYLAQHPLFEQIPELKADMILPDYCSCGDGKVLKVRGRCESCPCHR